ncbi:MAG TPA: hypothetical protein VF755_29760 [Catenuloplanes sp.]|jgi:hypothetical protein
MTTQDTVEPVGYRLYPRLLGHAPVRWAVLTGWLVGAAGIWVDALIGPFDGWLFLPAAFLCLACAGALLWGYRRVLFHFSTGLDEREMELRAHVYQKALGILTVFVLVVWVWILMAARQDNGWHLKEVAHLLPLTLIWAPGAAAALVLPKDEHGTDRG